MSLATVVSNDLVSVKLKNDDSPSFIGAWYLEDLSVCDDLIDLHNNNPDLYQGMMTLGDKQLVDKKTKDSIDLDADDDPTNPVYVKYCKEVQKVLECYMRRYTYSNRMQVFKLGNVVTQKYPKNGAYHKWHTERVGLGSGDRHLVYMTYLNDINDDGETEFFYQKLKVKPRKGLTLIWPTDWTHMHRGIPSSTEVKYISTGWYKFTGE
jgi:hypothetical protein|tara:strand:- start:28 stop:651 length:624 start_codon:yes stop_codon:yes gene_type:complete